MSNKPPVQENSRREFPYLLGIGFISVGLAIFLEQFLKTGWLVLVILPVGGAVFLVEATRTRKVGLLIAGSLIFGVGLGGFLYFSSALPIGVAQRVGWLILSIAAGFALITAGSVWVISKRIWWPMIPAGVLFFIGLCFLITPLRLVDFVLFIVGGVGVVLLIWGVFWRIFGLIIPGSLMITIGPGIYFAWGTDLAINALSKTGMMIAIFALGWGLMILFSRVVTTKFIWWPLIPGGVMAVVGWGLYIGGDPGNAPSFIANTGSIGLIIFGLYLLLLRKGIHH